jgi:hypothetical protein
LRVPDVTNGYRSSAIRVESVQQAQEIDARLLEVWSRHPHRVVIDTNADFFEKAKHAVDELRRLAKGD